MMWILIAIVLLCLPLVHANSGLKRWKTEHCLYETEKTEHRIELKAVGKVRRVNFLPFSCQIWWHCCLHLCRYGQRVSIRLWKNNRIKQYRVAYDHHMAVWTGYDCCSSLDGQTADSGDK